MYLCLHPEYCNVFHSKELNDFVLKCWKWLQKRISLHDIQLIWRTLPAKDYVQIQILKVSNIPFLTLWIKKLIFSNTEDFIHENLTILRYSYTVFKGKSKMKLLGWWIKNVCVWHLIFFQMTVDWCSKRIILNTKAQNFIIFERY